MVNSSKSEEEIYYAALEEPPGRRLGYVKDACGDNLELLERVESLLKIREDGNNFLESPIFDTDVTLDDSAVSEGPGTAIGRYKLLERIGEGGMAVVYMAQQEQPIRRKVALKIIKVGMDTKQVVARFEAERQALALMDHPHIAKVLDAGATDAGRPYFVMELVRGVPITEYCDRNTLSTRQRLDLFVQVCSAVQHAHQKGIIHRDIKPSNVMVALHDDSAVPKVIDFGIARATNQKLTEKTLFTRYEQMIGTPVYMSPEQAQFSDLDIDTRTDIYSLGVLLYELLIGTTPLDSEELRGKGYAEMQRIIQEEEPPKPSTKLSTMGEALTGVAAYRSSSPDSLRKSVKGDLDWIVMKCLEKNRIRRYDAANGLASDIKRHIDNEPVVARPPSAAYRFLKACRRNKVVFTAAAAVVIALLLGTGISVWQGTEARKSEVNAMRRAYNSDMSLAFSALEENLFGRVQDIVSRYMPEPGEPDFRGWEWRYAWAQSQSDAASTWYTPEEMGEVAAVRISPDQRYMVSSAFYYGPTFYHYARRLWDFETRQELKDVHLPGGSPGGFVFSNSGKYLVLHRGRTDLHGGNDAHEIHIYDTATWELETVIPLEKWTPSLSFSPDDTALATIVGPMAVLWDWRGQKIIHEWPVEGSGAWLNVVAFFPDGRRLAIGGSNGLKMVDPTTGDIEYQQPAPNGVITALAVSADSRYVAIGSGHGNGDIGVLNTASWEPEPPLIGHSRSVTSLTFATNGERLISASADSTIRVWDMDSRVTTRLLKGHQSGVGSVSLTSDESRAVSAGIDKRILEWDLNAPLRPFREHLLAERVKQVVFSADSRSFYTVNNEGTVSIWDTETFLKQHSLSPELGERSSIILSPDGNHLIVGTGSGQLWVLDAGGLQVVARRSTQSGRILPVGFSADGKSLVALEPPNKISLWSAETWQLRSSRVTTRKIKFLNKNFKIYAIPQDSDVLLYPSGADLVWWDIELSKEQASIRVNSKFPGSIAVSPTEPLLASADRGDFLSLWNWQTRQPAGDRLRGPGAFNGVAFSPDGQRLVTGGRDKGALMIWDVSTRQQIARFGASSADLTTVQFSPDGNIICAVDTKGTAYFVRAPSLEKINALEAKQHQTERR